MEKNEEQRKAVDRVDEPEQSRPAADLPALPQQALPAAGDEQPGPANGLERIQAHLSAIERLKTTIDKETEKLEIRATPVDFDGFSQRKNRGLLELTRAMRLTQGVGARSASGART